MATQVITTQGLFESGRKSAEEMAVERNLSLLAQQHRARRGPTPEVFFVKRFDNSRLVKAADPQRMREMRGFACAMACLFALVMMYGWQHFSSIEYGYRVESEKQQVVQLEEQNRQLRLTEAQLADPARIDRIARQYGLDVPRPGQVVRPDASMDANGPAMAQMTPALPIR
jgi:cell division protein FtsL